tara:strand:- start:71 stop:352 length:282 start_codon:yes stop_codon:yes gene_type:complete
MSFEVKNIEQENINFSKLFFMAVVLIITVVASTIFVYYWFTFEKMDVMQQQYLAKESDIKKEHDLTEEKKFNEMEISAAKEELEKKYLFKYDK